MNSKIKNVNEYIDTCLNMANIYYIGWNESDVGAFFIHSSIFAEFKKRSDMITILKEWDYELQVGDTSYDMKLVFLERDRSGSFKPLWKYCSLSDVAFLWEDKLALYVPVKHYVVLERFILLEKLDTFIESIEDRHDGLLNTKEVIRVVRFTFQKKHIKIDLASKFQQYYYKESLVPKTTNFYFRVAFPWLQPWVLEHFDIPFEIDNPYDKIILIVLEYTNYLSNNIFDLVAARMALCDCRNLESTEFVQSVIDRIIVRLIDDPKYNKNGGFDLDKYMYDNNITTNKRIDWLMAYFVYTFQNFLGSSVKGDFNSRQTIKLCDNRDVVDLFKMLTLKSNLKYRIDGTNFDGMSFKLFNDLMSCHNVKEIVLDTNYRLDNNMDGIDGSKCLNKKTHVSLYGDNIDGFVEEFVLCAQLTDVDNMYRALNLYINCELINYSIFDNIEIMRLIFENITITTSMLENFNECAKFKTKILFQNCTIDNNGETWMLLNNLKHLDKANIREENYTWQSICDAVQGQLSVSGKTYFRFRSQINILSTKTIRIRNLNFQLLKHENILHVQNFYEKKDIDLFDLKFKLKPDDKVDYDFYQ